MFKGFEGDCFSNNQISFSCVISALLCLFSFRTIVESTLRITAHDAEVFSGYRWVYMFSDHGRKILSNLISHSFSVPCMYRVETAA